MQVFLGILLSILIILPPTLVCSQVAPGDVANSPVTTLQSNVTSSAPQSPADENIPIGTVITTQNWQSYKQYMPQGMRMLFEGRFAWKIPSDIHMEIGPTIIHTLPPTYREATNKFSSQVKLIELPSGGLTISGYKGGMPFPEPTDPHRGWKILANLWYRYMPHLMVDTHGNACLMSIGGAINCEAGTLVYRQLAYNTDPGVPANTPGAEGRFFSQWLMVIEPEQQRYTASLNISYDDVTSPDSSYLFIPALRRYQTVSSLARCSPNQGTDSTLEDNRFGFDSNLTELTVDFLGEGKIIALLPTRMPAGTFPADFELPLAWPKPSWGKWQVRDVYEIDVRKIASRASGYCYGKRVMYVDKASSAPIWEDLYDSKMKLWKLYGLFLHPIDVPGLGVVDASGSMVYSFWDVQNNHATFFIDPGEGHPFYVNDQAPPEYLDVTRYAQPSGLSLIMR
jgi:uncharacterized protein DUF1329